MPNITLDYVARISKPGLYRDDRLKGFVLRIGSSKVKSYQVSARIKGGKPVFYTIGKDGAPWNAKTARIEAERILALMKLGIDPRDEAKEEQEKRAAKEAKAALEQRRAELTLRRVFEEWCADQKKVKASTKNLYRQVMFKHLADWLDQPLSAITSEACVKRYDNVADETVASANNTFRALRMLFNWEIARQEEMGDQQFITTNPVSALSRRKRDKWRSVEPRTNVVADEDLKAWFDGVKELPPKFQDYFMLVALTAIRRNEALDLRWSDVDFKSGTFTCRDTKNGSDHRLPMTDFVRSLFKRRLTERNGEEFVFPSIRSQSGRVRDVGYWTRKLTARSGVDFTSHALRRTFSFNASVLLSDASRKQIMNHMKRSDVTDAHYSPKVMSVLRECMESTEARIFRLAGIDPNSELTNPAGRRKVVALLDRR